jgi:hypothetical protein
MTRKKTNLTKPVAATDHPIHQSARLPIPAALHGKSTREFVFECIAAAAPAGAEFDDDSILSQIPVLGDDVGVCLNYRIPLVGPNAWRAKQIKGSWNVATLTALTDHRRSH